MSTLTSRVKQIFKSWGFAFAATTITLACTLALTLMHRNEPAAYAGHQTTLAFSAAALVNLTIAFAIGKGRLRSLTLLFLALFSITAFLTFARLFFEGITSL